MSMVEQALRLESGELETQEPRRLVQQIVELRRQLQEEQASYWHKLQAYQEGQQQQAQLVLRLQGKNTDHSQDLESILIWLEEEQPRSASLAQVNAML
ncbi:rootletin-like [Pongo abelii]|uniref:rootletin-like n=1 Tax=Pongo abelii TaxID=9601 RepID=UPI0030056D35